jgi:predicted DNA-binding WGR domain protein
MTTRLENTTGNSSKFWEIDVDGSTTTVRYGKIGSSGQTQTKE